MRHEQLTERHSANALRYIETALEFAVVFFRNVVEKFGDHGVEVGPRHFLQPRKGLRERLHVLVADPLDDRAGGLRAERGDDQRRLLRRFRRP